MNQALVVFAVFISLIAAMLVAGIPTKVYSFAPSPPSSPSVSTDNNTSSTTITSNQLSPTNTTTSAQWQQQLTKSFD